MLICSWALCAAFSFGFGSAHAQQSAAALITEINTNYPDNTTGLITPALLRTTSTDIVNSYLNLVTGGTVVGGVVVTGALSSSTYMSTPFLLASTSVTSVPADAGGATPSVNLARITSDNVAAGVGFILGHQTRYVFGGAATTGGRIAGYDFIANTAITSAGNTNRNYVARSSNVYTAVGDGGTNTGANALGGYFGINPSASLDTGATNVFHASAGEFDIKTAVGSSSRYITGIFIAGFEAVRGTDVDAALAMTGSSASGTFGPHIGWNTGILFTDIGGASPVYSGTTLLSNFWTAGGTKAVTAGIDLTGFTFSGNAFASPQFTLSGGGVIGLTATWNASTISVTRGGTGLTAGQSGGIPYFSSSTTLSFTTLLVSSGIMLGGGAGGAPTAMTGCTGNATSNITCTSATSGQPTPIFENTTSDGASAQFVIRKQRSGSAVNSGDTIGAFAFQPFVNAAYNNGALFRALAEGTASGSNQPTRWEFVTGNSAGQVNQTLAFNSAAHVYITQASNPTVNSGSCGTTPAISGSDFAGEITVGTGAPTSCTLNFATLYAAVPYCVVVEGALPSTQPMSYIVLAGSIGMSWTVNASGTKVYYHCIARSGG